MSILKFEPRTCRSLYDMVSYMTDSAKTDENGIFGIGLNPRYAAIEMEYVQRVYNRICLNHPYVQVILSFDKEVFGELATITKVCYKIGKSLILDERQVFGAVHFKNTANIHCHYMINYVGVQGTLYRQEISLHRYKCMANEILAEYGLPKILFYDTA